jgi:hypothetical protein
MFDQMCLPEGRRLWVDAETVVAIDAECFAIPLIEAAMK